MNSNVAAVPPDGRILFFARDRTSFPFLSHFYPSPVFVDVETWPTVEHYYQSQRSDDPAYREAIRYAVSPGIACERRRTPKPHL